MKRSPAKPAKPRETRQSQLQSDFAAAGTMRERFPQLAELHIDLAFTGGTALQPSAQSFSLYPAARAFFKYRCPCTDCDGLTDLSAVVKALAARALQSPARSSGQIPCPGTRLGHSTSSHACPMLVTYELRAVPRREVETHGTR